jgi:hypothetical protein
MGFSAMTSRCRGSAGAALVLAAGLAAPLAAVEPDMADPGPYMVPSTMEQTLGPRDLTPSECDLRLGFGVAKAPQIRERLTSGGHDVDYDWNGNNSTGESISLGTLVGLHHLGHDGGRIIAGGELDYQYFNTTPTAYETANGAAPNNRQDLKLNWQTLGLEAEFGYGTEPIDSAIGFLHAELLAVGGGGPVWAKSVEALGNGTSEVAAGEGFYLSGGWRLGLYATRGDFQFGLRGDWQWSTARATVDYPGGDHSLLVGIRNGYDFEAEIGYRF